jgi:hypothetical protein
LAFNDFHSNDFHNIDNKKTLYTAVSCQGCILHYRRSTFVMDSSQSALRALNTWRFPPSNWCDIAPEEDFYFGDGLRWVAGYAVQVRYVGHRHCEQGHP